MIGVIADDLSGAAELGAIGLRHGLRAEIVVDGRCGDGADLVCVDTDSRGCGAEEAETRVRAAVRALRTAGARWIYKKVDSVLRGQVMPEVRGAMAELNLRRAVLVPANPSLGRVIRDGKYFVGGKLLHETEFARDPQHPRNSSVVSELLANAELPEVRVCKPGDQMPDLGIAVGEAETAEDLRAWASRLDAEILPAGAAEFFGTVLKLREPRGAIIGNIPPPMVDLAASGELFVCGSTSESSQKFIEEARQMGAPVFSLPKELGAGAAFDPVKLEMMARQAGAALREGRRVILNVGLPLVREAAVARLLVEQLVNVAWRVFKEADVVRVYAEGGETAAALARRMGWGRLAVLHELAPGVVTVAVEGNKNLRFTLKPGTYAWPEEVRKTSR